MVWILFVQNCKFAELIAETILLVFIPKNLLAIRIEWIVPIYALSFEIKMCIRNIDESSQGFAKIALSPMIANANKDDALLRLLKPKVSRLEHFWMNEKKRKPLFSLNMRPKIIFLFDLFKSNPKRGKHENVCHGSIRLRFEFKYIRHLCDKQEREKHRNRNMEMRYLWTAH